MNKQAKKIAEKLNIEDRIEKIQESEAYIMVKDHEKVFQIIDHSDSLIHLNQIK